MKTVPNQHHSHRSTVKSIVTDKPFIFLDIATLREYLKIEFFYDNIIPSKSDFERLLDDWVFMSFFIGNDFFTASSITGH